MSAPLRRGTGSVGFQGGVGPGERAARLSGGRPGPQPTNHPLGRLPLIGRAVPGLSAGYGSTVKHGKVLAGRVSISLRPPGPPLLPLTPYRWEESGAGVDDFGQCRSDPIPESLDRTEGLRRRFRGKTSLGYLGERPHHEIDELGGVRERHRRRRQANLSVPMAEDDGGGVGMPGRAQVLVAAAHVGQEDTIRGHLRHNAKYAPSRPRLPLCGCRSGGQFHGSAARVSQ
jgi:hypothetical protein